MSLSFSWSNKYYSISRLLKGVIRSPTNKETYKSSCRWLQPHGRYLHCPVAQRGSWVVATWGKYCWSAPRRNQRKALCLCCTLKPPCSPRSLAEKGKTVPFEPALENIPRREFNWMLLIKQSSSSSLELHFEQDSERYDANYTCVPSSWWQTSFSFAFLERRICAMSFFICCSTRLNSAFSCSSSFCRLS